VPYAIPGVGAVATQAAANRLYGPKAIELLKHGLSPADVVKRLTEEDPGRDTRQLAVIDGKGRSAVYTLNPTPVRFARTITSNRHAGSGGARGKAASRNVRRDWP
jgi:uncharacterized Ntn-hydrolase superfamily protein